MRIMRSSKRFVSEDILDFCGNDKVCPHNQVSVIE